VLEFYASGRTANLLLNGIIILAFIPVFSLTGEEGKLFHPLAFTKTFAMAGATIIAVTLVPVLCTFLLRGKFHPEQANPVMRALHFNLSAGLAVRVESPAAHCPFAALLFVGSIFRYRNRQRVHATAKRGRFDVHAGD